MLQKLDRLFVFSYNVQPAAWYIFSASIHAAPVVTKMWRMWTLLWNKWMWASVVWGHQFCTPDGRMEQVRYTNHRMSTITHYVCVCVRACTCACAFMNMNVVRESTHWPSKPYFFHQLLRSTIKKNFKHNAKPLFLFMFSAFPSMLFTIFYTFIKCMI